MKVRIQRIDKSLPLPVYETAGSVGFDILARETTKIEPGKIELIPSNVIVEVPEGYMLVVASRSSTPRKKGLTQPHGFGIIDHDYCGPEDEVRIQVYNFSGQPVTIERGEKSPRVCLCEWTSSSGKKWTKSVARAEWVWEYRSINGCTLISLNG